MTEETAIKLFQDKRVRVVWDNEQEERYFSIVDVVRVLTESTNPNNYWKVLKKQTKKGRKRVEYKCNQLNMLQSSDGKFYKSSEKASLVDSVQNESKEI